MEIAFLLIGLAFFVYMITFVERGNDRIYHRRIEEAREFGVHERKHLNDRRK